jgi:hypothetical protein
MSGYFREGERDSVRQGSRVILWFYSVLPEMAVIDLLFNNCSHIQVILCSYTLLVHI